MSNTFLCVTMEGWQNIQAELQTLRSELDALKGASSSTPTPPAPANSTVETAVTTEPTTA